MAYQNNASDQAICNQLCPFQIGDKVTLTKKLAAGNGFFERGTVLEILSVAVRQDLQIRSVSYEKLSLFQADVGVFEFELIDPETLIKVKATADYWGESLLSRKRMNRLLLRLYTPTIFAAICLVILLFRRNEFAAVAALALVFLLIDTGIYSGKLRSKMKPDLWK